MECGKLTSYLGIFRRESEKLGQRLGHHAQIRRTAHGRNRENLGISAPASRAENGLDPACG
ncbi:hypothetical protein ANRL2_01560 [Anaerolineae bacterium]|nr:hypothetical protein ANRL2_01560 [Anaerolineae bacterium]